MNDRKLNEIVESILANVRDHEFMPENLPSLAKFRKPLEKTLKEDTDYFATPILKKNGDEVKVEMEIGDVVHAVGMCYLLKPENFNDMNGPSQTSFLSYLWHNTLGSGITPKHVVYNLQTRADYDVKGAILSSPSPLVLGRYDTTIINRPSANNDVVQTSDCNFNYRTQFFLVSAQDLPECIAYWEKGFKIDNASPDNSIITNYPERSKSKIRRIIGSVTHKT